jgi:two-component system, NtrC family, response regulator AtoC
MTRSPSSTARWRESIPGDPPRAAPAAGPPAATSVGEAPVTREICTPTAPAQDAAHAAAGVVVLVLADRTVARHPVSDGSEVSLGRAPENLVAIDDPSVSRRHACVHLGATPAIEDAGSTNGTWVRGRRLSTGVRYPLAFDEIVRLGEVLVVMRRRPLAAAAETAAVAAPPEDDAPMFQLQRQVERIAKTTLNALILGETGVGKELLAETVHKLSPRAKRPFVKLNCAAFPETLLESHLFGHERGAFTGAIAAKPGLLETAEGGTVFLDEVGELPMPVQAKLLRVIEERQVLPVGGLRARAIDVRFVAATNRDLEGEIARGTFRQDLYYRLNGISFWIPPLRRRISEIDRLARLFIARATRHAELAAEPDLSDAALAMLLRYHWPGNIRELRNAMERAVYLSTDGEIRPEHLPVEMLARPAPPAAVDHARPGDTPPDIADERRRLIDALQRCGGNQTEAARVLGISRRTLVSRLTAYGLPRPRKLHAGQEA